MMVSQFLSVIMTFLLLFSNSIEYYSVFCLVFSCGETEFKDIWKGLNRNEELFLFQLICVLLLLRLNLITC